MTPSLTGRTARESTDRPHTHASRTTIIAELNDMLRRTGVGGRVLITAGVAALAPELQAGVLAAVARFDAWEAGNDPYGEHDFGAVEVGGIKLFFKIDYFDSTEQQHSPDPADPALTARVLTIMLAEEY